MPGVHEIQVTLKKYEFNPGTLRVKKGEQVRLILDAADLDHGFKLNEFDVNQKVQKGTTATVEFIADKAGLFNFAVRVSVVWASGTKDGNISWEHQFYFLGVIRYGQQTPVRSGQRCILLI